MKLYVYCPDYASCLSLAYSLEDFDWNKIYSEDKWFIVEGDNKMIKSLSLALAFEYGIEKLAIVS